jgi:hypothetical protein
MRALMHTSLCTLTQKAPIAVIVISWLWKLDVGRWMLDIGRWMLDGGGWKVLLPIDDPPTSNLQPLISNL